MYKGAISLKVRLYHPLSKPTTRQNPYHHCTPSLRRPGAKIGGLGERKRFALSCPRSAGVTKIKHTLKYLLFSADLPKNPGTPSSISKRRYRYGLKRTKTDKYGPDGDNKTFACRLKHSGVQSVVAHKFSQQQVTGVIARKLAPRCYLPQSCAQGDYRYGLKRTETEVYRPLS